MKIIKIILDTSVWTLEMQLNDLAYLFRITNVKNWESCGNTVWAKVCEDDYSHIELLKNIHKTLLGDYAIFIEDQHIFKDTVKYCLPINEKETDISTFPYISMFLPTIDLKKHKGWLYSNFINIVYVKNHGFYSYVDDRDFFKDALEINGLQYTNYYSFDRDNFIGAIKSGYYVYVWIDSNIFTDWTDNPDIHEAHPILIYGYDLGKNIYHTYRFSPQKGLYFNEYDIDKVHRASDMARMYILKHKDDYHIAFVKPKQVLETRTFDARRFLNEFYDYVFGGGSVEKQCLRSEISPKKKSEFIFGIEITKKVSELFLQHKFYNNFDYRLIHLITEHKNLLCRRLEYVNEYYIGRSEFNKLINEYKKICNTYETFKMKYIKKSISQTNGRTFYVPPDDEKVQKLMSNAYLELYESELSVLKKMFMYVDRLLLYTSCKPESIVTDISQKAYVKKEKDCIVLKWNEDVYVDSVSVYVPGSLCSVITQEKFTIHCNGKEIMESSGINGNNILYELRGIRTNKVCFKADNSLLLDYIVKYVNVYQSDVAAKAINITASSSYDIFLPENLIKENSLFWCPNENDDNMYVEFEFLESTNISSVVIEQEYSGTRIRGYSISAYANEKWEEVYANDDAEESTILVSRFEVAKDVERMRVCILRTKVDGNGQNVPLIVRVKMYQL